MQNAASANHIGRVLKSLMEKSKGKTQFLNTKRVLL